MNGEVQIVIAQQPISAESWWTRQREGFTAFCRSKFGEFITADSTDGIKVLQERAAMLATLEAIRQAKAHRVIRHANAVGRN